jgi:hypothetical protein
MSRLSPALLVLVSACSDGLAPVFERGEFNLQFTVAASRCSQDLFDTFDRHALGDEGMIRITDIYSAPQGGYQLWPRVDWESSLRLTATIEGESTEPGITISICHAYELIVGQLPRGGYDLILRHSDRALAFVDTVRVTHVNVR